MRNEILLCRARLAEKKKRLNEIDLRADSYIRIIREIIDPYGGDFADFGMDRARVTMEDFYALWEEKKALRLEIAKMEKDLSG